MTMHREFHEAGFRVFGLHSVIDGKCECGAEDCKALFKHPRFSNWQHTPEWDDEQLDNMEEAGHFDTGFGLLAHGYLIVDVDARNGGVAAYGRLFEAIPEIANAGMIVETGSGNGSKHLYFKAPEGVALVQHHNDYEGCDFKSSGYVVGPGSKHASGNTYRVLVGSPEDVADAPQALIDLLKRPEVYRATFDGKSLDINDTDLADMLSYVTPDCDHSIWVRCGMSVHHATQGAGFSIWDSWSAQSKTKYPGHDALQRRWHSFGKSANPVTIGTLIHYAKAAGWSSPVTFNAGESFSDYVDESSVDGLPFSLDSVDLTSPPGFVGEVAAWIESQSRRPRRHLSVAGALIAIGNVAGLRYTDDKDRVTTNLFVFCVAGSRTGKESIQQAVAEIHRCAGLGAATHGAIKSEQEIVRNLVRHQPALYVIDEIGIFLQKVQNAQKRGGAAYLDGVIGILMSAYSKAEGFMLLTGDAREEIREAMMKEAKQVNKMLSDCVGDIAANEKRLKDIEAAMQNIENGLPKPFLSLIGFTTPITFDGLIDFESATNGFVGRSLIFNERETAPQSKRNFARSAMPKPMEAALIQLFNGGEHDTKAVGRVERAEDRVAIPSTPEAVEFLNRALDWLEDEAILHKGRTGLESLYLGAYEMVSKISLILGAPSGLRTAEHVRWAFALIRSDIDAKARLVTANDRQEDAPELAMAARIANIIDGDGEKRSVVYNRLRKFRRSDIDKVLDQMVKDGVVYVDLCCHPVNGTKYEVMRMNA